MKLPNIYGEGVVDVLRIRSTPPNEKGMQGFLYWQILAKFAEELLFYLLLQPQ